ncbi:hypothetical protein K8T06_16835, partial [bacterium]|nr:hypothetical protein [bacterium]
LLVGAEGALYRLEQGSAKWKLSELPASVARINRIAGTIDGSQIYLATSHGAMASYDSGKRFTRSTGNLPDIQCLDLCVEEEGQVIVLLGDHSVYFRQINAYKWEHLITLPFDAWSLHTLANSDVLCIGTPANGVVLVPKNVD